RLRALVLGASVLALVLSVLLVRVIVRRGLRPIARMADKAHRIDESRLGERFPVSSVPRELRPIASRLNTLLRRLDRAFQRERRFIDNVAHELLTPIAELR